MKPERGLRKNSVSWVFSGVSMTRSPIGSLPASIPSNTRNIPPCGLVFGTVALSTTLIQGVERIAVKYLAASLISSSVIDLAKLLIKLVLAFRGSDVLRESLWKFIICCTKYSYVRAVMLAFLGRR